MTNEQIVTKVLDRGILSPTVENLVLMSECRKAVKVTGSDVFKTFNNCHKLLREKRPVS